MVLERGKDYHIARDRTWLTAVEIGLSAITPFIHKIRAANTNIVFFSIKKSMPNKPFSPISLPPALKLGQRCMSRTSGRCI